MSTRKLTLRDNAHIAWAELMAEYDGDNTIPSRASMDHWLDACETVLDAMPAPTPDRWDNRRQKC